jgi:RNA-binding protein 25
VQLKANKKPTDIVDDMAQILDQEAEIFTVKLWRLLIYESEAARLGLN